MDTRGLMEGDSCVRQQGAQGRGLTTGRFFSAFSSPVSLFFPVLSLLHSTDGGHSRAHISARVLTSLNQCLDLLLRWKAGFDPLLCILLAECIWALYTLAFSYLKLDDNNSVFLTVLLQGFSGS